MSNVLPFPSHPASREAVPEPRLKDVIGDVLREERTAQARTLADVADEAAVSLPYLSEIERGRKDASSEVLEAICDSLELPVSDLLERSADRLRIDAGTKRATGLTLMAA